MNKYLLSLIGISLLVLAVILISRQSPDTGANLLESESTSNAAMIDNNEVEVTAAEEQELDSISEPSAAVEEVEVEATTQVTKEKAPVVAAEEPEPANLPVSIKTMLIAGGCFWCVEADAEKLPGVIEAVSGYAEGSVDNPTYKNYSKTGHREVVEVTYDENRVSFGEVIINAIKHMDPTDDDGSFNDRGDYYSPALYYDNAEQKQIIEATIKRMDEFGPYDKPLAIEVIARPKFWPAEDYHQDYYKGTLSALKYKYYRSGSGRDAFIKKYWGSNTGPTLP